MDITNLKTAFRTVLLKWIVSKIDAATIRALLGGLVEQMKAKTAGTENPFDDAAVSAIEYILESDEHLQAIVAWLIKKLTKQPEPDGVCESAEGAPEEDEADEIAELAMEICKQQDGVCESTAAVTVVIQILQVVLPLILSYLKDTQPEPKE